MRINLSVLFLVFSALFPSVLVAQPSAPTLTAVLQLDKTVALTYTKVPGALSYNVYWSMASDFTTLTSISHQNTTGSSYTLQPVLTNGTKYFFAVTAVTSNGESAASNVMSATPDAQQQGQQVAPGQDGNGNPPASGAAPAQPTTNVGQSPDTNIQTPSMTYVPLTPATYPILGSSAGQPNGKIAYDSAGVEALVNAGCSTAFNPASGLDAAFNDGSTYVIVHVIDLAGTAGAQNVKSSNWYVYSKHKTFGSGFAGGWRLADFDGATRLYGAKRILLLSILENNLNPGAPEISYSLTVTKQQATNVSDALQLLGLVFPQGTVAGLRASPTSYWACSSVPVAYKTSTVKIDFAYSSGGGSPYSASQSFVNEAKEHWDFSFAFPVKKASALQYSSTAGTVTASKINKSDLFAVFDWYPYPVDLKNSKFTFIPGVFAGVAMNSQPLHSLLFGASIGAKLAQVYAGALLIKQQQLNGLSTGSSGTAAQVTSATTYGYKASFSIGIKVSVSAAASAIAGSKK